MILKEIKRRTKNLLCVEFSGNKGHISVCNVLEAIILLVVLILFVGAIASIIGAAIYDPDCYTGEGASIIYIFTFKHIIIGSLATIISALTIICSVEVLKMKVMDCPICGKKEEDKRSGSDMLIKAQAEGNKEKKKTHKPPEEKLEEKIA